MAEEESSSWLKKLSDVATGQAQRDSISNSTVGELAKALGESVGERFKSIFFYQFKLFTNLNL